MFACLTPGGAPPARALPTFARQYNIPCSTCHSVVPKLNKTGLAFQANYFKFPGGRPASTMSTGLARIPLSGLMGNTWGNSQTGPSKAQFQTFELFATGSMNPSAPNSGGFWIDELAAANDGSTPGDLDGAWVSLPIAGHYGQLSTRIGQISPINYQWDGISVLSASLPTALDDPIDEISMDSATPGVDLEYFNHRGRKSADGFYVDLGMPFGGHLTLNRDSRLYRPHGAYVHTFERTGLNTEGFFAYRNDSASQEGIIATRDITNRLSLLGIGAVGGDVAGNEQHVSFQADYLLSSSLALTGRYDVIRGVTHDDYPVAAINWYPFGQRTIRITGELFGQKANRSNTIYANLQL